MSDAAQKRVRDPDTVDLTDDPSPEKKQKKALTAIAKEFVCPITQELPINPVTAEDGKIYEETAIREWFSKKDGEPTSPSTGAVIGTKLFPAPQARNTIEALVESGAIEGEIAEAWKEKLELETLVKETRAKADGGDGKAMYRLGMWYQFGLRGLAEDTTQARAWYGRSAAVRYPKGMARFGECLMCGRGGSKNHALGLVMVSQAAALGSDLAAYLLGYAFSKGTWGLPKLRAQGQFWIKKVVDGECEVKHLNDNDLAKAAGWLRELQEA